MRFGLSLITEGGFALNKMPGFLSTLCHLGVKNLALVQCYIVETALAKNSAYVGREL